MPTGRRRPMIAALLATLCLVGPSLVGQTTTRDRPLVVGTKEAAPFSIKNDDGSWSGISIDLWREIAGELGLEYELHEMTLEGLLAGLEDRTVDVGVAALTVTADREARMDFSHPLYAAGLGIAIKRRSDGRWAEVLRHLFSIEFAGVVLVLTFLLVSVGFVMWLVERRKNDEHFGGPLSRGLGSAIWWSAVTITTVGYGDKAPRSVLGRLLAILWMFAGVLLISSFAATVTSILTVRDLSRVHGPDDLTRVAVGTIAGTTSEEYLQRRHLAHRTFSGPGPALDALASGEIDAVVYDAPILRYLVSLRRETPVTVLHTAFGREDYAFGLVSGSPHREAINRVLLRRTQEEAWVHTLARYIGY